MESAHKRMSNKKETTLFAVLGVEGLIEEMCVRLETGRSMPEVFIEFGSLARANEDGNA